MHTVGVCVFGGWLNWPYLAQSESGGVGMHACGALANQCTPVGSVLGVQGCNHVGASEDGLTSVTVSLLIH